MEEGKISIRINNLHDIKLTLQTQLAELFAKACLGAVALARLRMAPTVSFPKACAATLLRLRLGVLLGLDVFSAVLLSITSAVRKQACSLSAGLLAGFQPGMRAEEFFTLEATQATAARSLSEDQGGIQHRSGIVTFLHAGPGPRENH
jgi:hypothetical protein